MNYQIGFSKTQKSVVNRFYSSDRHRVGQPYTINGEGGSKLFRKFVNIV